MLRSANDFSDFSIGATDGDIGQVEEFYFDDEQWTVRYIVVNTGGWFHASKVLISPLSVGKADWTGRYIETALTRAEVKESPRVDTERPTSRQQEAAYNDHFKFPYYSAGPKLWAPDRLPGEFSTRGGWAQPGGARAAPASDSQVHSTKEVTGYPIAASDGGIGHLDDFIIDDENWTIRYLAVDTRNWWPGKKVLLSPRWITRVSWQEQKIDVALPRQQIKNSPEYDDSASIQREYEEQLHRYYGETGYWSG